MKRVAIVIGHDYKEQGAFLAKPFEFLSEYEYNSFLAATILAHTFEMSDFEFKVFLRDDRGIKRTYKAVDKWEPDASVELHFNSFGQPRVSGCEVLYGNTKGARKFAAYMQEKLLAVMGGPDRHIKFRGENEDGGISLNVRNEDSYARILIEPFFGSNFSDAEKGLLNINSLARAVVQASVKFLTR